MGREWISRPNDIELLVRARLVDRQHRPDPHGQHYGLVMKYSLLGIVRTKGGSPEDFPYKQGDSFYVVHGVPELPRPSYHKVK